MASAVMTGSTYQQPSMTTIFQLKKGNKVNVIMLAGFIYDNNVSSKDPHFTHFTGMLLQENLNF